MTTRARRAESFGSIKGDSPADPEKTASSGDFLNKINGFAFFLTAALLIHLFIFKDYLLFKKLLIFLDAGSDAYNQFYPGFIHSVRYILTDGLPTWSFHEGMGRSIFPGGINDPLFWMHALFGLDHLAYGIVVIEILKSLITGITVYFFLKVFNLSNLTCAAGAVMASFSGYLIIGSSGWYGHSANVVYFVLLLYAFELFYQRNNRLLFPVAVFFIAGNPFDLYLLSVFLLTYSVFRIFSDSTWNFRQSFIFLLKLAGLGAVGVGMSTVFFYNSLFSMINSPRVAGDVQAVGSLLSVPVFGLVDGLEAATILMRFFSNDMMGTGSQFSGWGNYLEAPAFYCGLVNLLIFPQILLISGKRKKIAFTGLLLLWMMPLVFPFFRFALYAFMGNYYKHGLSLFVPFLFLFYGIHALERLQAKNASSDTVLIGTLIVLLCLLYFPFWGSPASDNSITINYRLRLVVSCFLLVYTIFLYLLKFDKLKLLSGCLLLCTICLEAGWLSAITINQRTALTREQFESKLGYNDYTVEAVAYLKSNDSGFYRINKDYPSSMGEFDSINDAKVHGYFGTPSYSSFNKQEYVEFLKAFEIIEKGKETKTRWAIGLLQRPLLQAVSSVKYNLVKPEDFAKKDAFYKLSYEPMTQFGDVMIMKHKHALPFGFTYDKYLSRNDFEKLSQAQKEMAIFLACISDHDIDGLPKVSLTEIQSRLKDLTLKNFSRMVDQKKASAMRLSNFSQKHFTGDISLDQKELVFFSIPYDRGWKASVNGRPAPTIQTNIGFTGIILDKGVHRIELNYLPEYIKPALGVSILFLMVYLGMVAQDTVGLRKSKHSPVLSSNN